MTALLAALGCFAERYHSSGLAGEQGGWHCTIALHASDTGERLGVRVEDGLIAGVGPAGNGPADLEVTAPSATLLDVLELRRGPNEPYLFGELTVRGAEADFVRLDYITESLCPL